MVWALGCPIARSPNGRCSVWNSSYECVQRCHSCRCHFMCQATTILLPEYAMHIANIVCTWVHRGFTGDVVSHPLPFHRSLRFRGDVQSRGYAHWYIDGSVINSGQFADIVRQKGCQPYHVILGARHSKGLTCASCCSGKDHFSSLTNGRVKGEWVDLHWFTPVPSHFSL